MAEDLPITQRSMAGLVATLGLELVSKAEGAVTFAGEPTAMHANMGGTIHGGYITTLLDTAMGYAAHTVLAPEQRCTTLELKISFIRALLPGSGRVLATGKVLAHGRRVVFAEAELTDGNGRVFASGTSTLLVIAR